MKSVFDNHYEYSIYKIDKARLYTDRVHDMAVILDNSIVEGPSYQLRQILIMLIVLKKYSFFENGTLELEKN